MSFTWRDVDEALARLDRVLRPRVGKRMTQLCVRSIVQQKESGASADVVMHSIHTSLDAYARLDESGTPFPLDVNRIIGARGCRKLFQLNSAQLVDMAPLVAQHADALLPAYGDDDAEFAVRVAWKNAHHYLLHLVVGRAFERNDHAPTRMLFDAWQAQGAPLVDARAPIGVVPADVGTPGVVYAASREDVDVVFVPDHGDPLTLSHVDGLQRFFAHVPLAITPDTLAWLLHLVRFAFGARVVVADGLAIEWEPKEGARAIGAASVLLGVPSQPVEERASIAFVDGDVVVARYTAGALSAA